jgi:AcrR family transcriptional regulator
MSPPTRSPSAARQRILDTAYELFSQNGIRSVGIDRIIDEAGVAKMTLYKHFPAKTDLALAFLDLREERWTRDWLQSEIDRQAASPRDRLLVPFDAFDEWFHRDDFEGCSFINTLLETHGTEPLHQAAVTHLAIVKDVLEGYADEAGMSDPEEVALQLQTLMMGSIVSASRGDREAARRARGVAELILDNATAGAPRTA